MAAALQAKRPLTCRAARQRTAVRCQAGQASQQVQLALATAAAASLLAAPAFAGVILTKPELKRVFVDDSPSVTTKSGSKAAKAAPAPKASKPVEAKVESGEGFEFNAYTLALPGALALVGGGAAVALKSDPEWFFKNLSKDSNVLGAGYEEVLKTGNGVAISISKPKAGTKLLKKK